jgi:hypothetical protein
MKRRSISGVIVAVLAVIVTILGSFSFRKAKKKDDEDESDDES